jgi:hypothetical protein
VVCVTVSPTVSPTASLSPFLLLCAPHRLSTTVSIAGFGGYAVWKAYKSPRRIMGGRLISDHPVYSLARGRRRAEAP